MMKHFINRIRRNERGVAILLVMSTVFVLAAVMVEFAFRANVSYHLAENHAEQLQAYYLARSSVELSKLIIKFDKDVEKRLKGTSLELPSTPLYKSFPLSSALLRAGLGEDVEVPEDEDQALPQDDEDVDGTSDIDQAMADADISSESLSVLQNKEAKEFLSFTGDFALNISEVESRMDLNVFFALDKSQPDYDPRKRWLLSLFKLEPFKAYFDRKDDATLGATLVNRIADWVDQNEVIDELGGVQRGSENDVYRSVEYLPKNGKLTTVDELGLIPLVTPELLQMLAPYVSIYDRSHQFNACLADETLVRAFIVMYSESNPCLTPIDPERNEDVLDTLTTTFLGGCPKPEEMVRLLDEAMGLGIGGVGNTKNAECSIFKLASLLTETHRVFEVVGVGTVGETSVKIQTVLDTTDDNPSKWKTEFFRVN